MLNKLDPFKELLWDGILNQTITHILARYPLLAWPPIAALVSSILIQYSDYFYDVFKTFINTKMITFQNKEHLRAYTKAALELQRIANEKGIDNPEYHEARNVRRKELENVIVYDAARKRLLGYTKKKTAKIIA